MGCVGGCVGGPRVMIKPEEGRENVNEYGKQANYSTPADNRYIFEMLTRLGYKTIKDLMQKDNMFVRNFSQTPEPKPSKAAV